MPMSVLNTWRNDLAKFTPNISYYLHHGEKKERRIRLRNWHKQYTKLRNSSVHNLRGKDVSDIHVILTTYEVIMKDCHILKNLNDSSKYKWAYLVVLDIISFQLIIDLSFNMSI